MKVRAAEKLSRRGLATHRIRLAIEFLDSHQPDWYLLPLHVFSGRVVIDVDDEFLVADAGRQLAIGDLVRSTLQELREEGPLGALRRFSDVVSMDPDVVAGSPVVKGTRLETDFLSALVDMGVTTGDLARDYRLSEREIERAVAFSRLAA